MAAPIYAPHPEENLNNYRPGGYHPVHLGDTFNDGRYTVLHKLGYGSYSTVWLVKDTVANTYASLVCIARMHRLKSSLLNPRSAAERSAYSRAYKRRAWEKNMWCSSSIPFSTRDQTARTSVLLQSCWVQVLARISKMSIRQRFSLLVLRNGSSRRLHWVSYLHKRSVVHGDIHLGNLLLFSENIVAVKKEGLETIYGKPDKQSFYLLEDVHALAPPSPHAPDYWVIVPDSTSLLHL
ncbi:hypothetical protein HGRIS_005805 [Hohenbuehelia grisea]|uniref:non-specific serine/threonine protein kinase n=1 Tax=Hohenbuehelia grisea TaxID=104357 RepID=A0ABR3JXY1_9AGAR